MDAEGHFIWCVGYNSSCSLKNDRFSLSLLITTARVQSFFLRGIDLAEDSLFYPLHYVDLASLFKELEESHMNISPIFVFS